MILSFGDQALLVRFRLLSPCSFRKCGPCVQIRISLHTSLYGHICSQCHYSIHLTSPQSARFHHACRNCRIKQMSPTKGKIKKKKKKKGPGVGGGERTAQSSDFILIDSFWILSQSGKKSKVTKPFVPFFQYNFRKLEP